MPLERERLKMWVREHRIEEEGDRSSCEGTGSKGQLVRWASEKIFVTSSVVANSKEERVECAAGQGMMGGEDVRTVEMSSRIASILSLK